MLVRTLSRLVSGALILAAAAVPAAAQTWNPSTDWSAGNNPSGPWSYGSASTLGGFDALPSYGNCYPSNTNVDCWYGPSNNGYTSAFVMHNFTNTTQLLDGGHSLPANYIELREVGSPDAVVRFTAPETGLFDISGNFQCDAGDCGGTNYLLFDGSSIFSSSTDPDTFSFTAFAMSAGQTLDFVLQGDGSTHDVDFATQITLENNGGGGVTTTPEPGSMALLGTGLVGLVPMVRRRSRR